MKVTVELDTWPEADTRRREWLPVETAAGRVDEGKLRKLIRSAPDHITAG